MEPSKGYPEVIVFTITKQFTFDASHQLEGLPAGHKCGRLHGHTYVVEVELSSLHLDSHGFVRDYGELDVVKRFLDTQWDHRHLNDWFSANTLGSNPTAENMARVVFDTFAVAFPELSAVRVMETPKTCAEYRP